MGELKIIKRNGEIDAVLHDGRYLLNKAIVTIENGKITYIDCGEWDKINYK